MSSNSLPPNFFAGPYIDRRSETRESPEWLDAARSDPATRYLVARVGALLVDGATPPRPALLRGAHPLVEAAGADRLTLLGWFRNAPCVLVEAGDDPAAELPPGASFQELRPLTSSLAPDEAGLLAYARAMSLWHARHRHCGVCGSPTAPERAGHVLRCANPACGHLWFPRIDPAIIVLVSDGDRALLGRQPGWPVGRYSTIAGFVEPGESLEDAVAREVLEETGVHARHIIYQSSQPWPFPASLMIGFQAQADSSAAIRVGDGGELEDARWFSRAEIAAGIPQLPPRDSISYRLVETWFDRGASTPLARVVPS